MLLLGRDIQKVGKHVAEYFALIFFILGGLYILSTYNNLLMLFIGIEILSIPQYVLAGSDKRNLKSSENCLIVWECWKSSSNVTEHSPDSLTLIGTFP